MIVAPDPSQDLTGSAEPEIAGAKTLPDLLQLLAARHGGETAAICEDGSFTYAVLHARSRKLALAMAADGVERGDRIGLLSGNGIDWLTVLFAAGMAGATVVPFSTWSTPNELSFLVSDAGCKLIFAATDFGGRDFAADLALILPNADETVVQLGRNSTPGFRKLDAPLSEGHALTAARQDDDALILYTSGSTSRPKGVRLVHADLVRNGYHIGERQGLHGGDRVFLPAPLFWAYGGANALPAAFTNRAALVLPQRFDAGQAVDMIARHRCTAIYTLPAITSAILHHPDFTPESVATLRTGVTIGSAQDFRLAVERLGVPDLCNVYGATETYGNCAVTWHDWPVERRARCQGLPLPGQEVRFRDPDSDAILPPGETGLAEVRGRISPGYSGQSASENSKAFTADGFYRTGDLGKFDDDGAFVFVGRASEMIKRAGINVSPAEIEDVLLRFGGVSEVAVTGVPDPKRGELIVAFVVCGDGPVDKDALNAHCRGLLSKYKLPDYFEIVDSLPLTATGKLQRKAVKDLAVNLCSERGVGS